MDLSAFRAAFPEFTNTTKYPDAQLTFWSAFAEAQLPLCVWKDTKPFAVYLYTAHEITMAYQNVQSSTSGGTPGVQGGIANTKTVGSVTVGYDQTLNSEKDAGWWNNTNYGKQLYRLIKIFGAGAIQL